MSITVRRWTDEDLEAVKHDKWLATLLMNTTSFSEEWRVPIHTGNAGFMSVGGPESL